MPWDPFGTLAEHFMAHAAMGVPSSSSLGGITIYFGGSPVASLTEPQIWWDTSVNPWKVKVNAANHLGVAGWIVFATGQRP